MYRIIAVLIFALGLLCGCSALPGVKWGGAYLGAQSVARFNHVPDRESASGYLNLIWNVGKRGSFQIEPIIPFSDPEHPILRLGADVKLF